MATTKKKISGKDLGIKIFLIATVIIIIAAIGFNMITSSGILLHSFKPLTSENYTVNAAMMNYFYKTSYYSFVNQASGYLSYLGLDTSRSLKSQTYTEDMTWHDYFLDSTVTQVEEMLVLAESARAEGIELSAEDIAEVDETMASIASTAAAYNYPSVSAFLAAQYGAGIKEKDVRAAIELSTLASSYAKKIGDSIEISEDEINTYFEENSESYTYVDLRQFSFAAPEVETADATEEEKAQMMATLKEKADALAACKTIAEFEAHLTEYMKNNVPEGQEITDENIANNIESTKYAKYNSRETEQGKWAFEDGRKAGETFIVEDEKSMACFVYMVERPAYRDETLARNVRHILFLSEEHTDAEGAKAKAEEILAEYQAGEKTEDAFAALATKYSEDPGSAENGGLYENVKLGDMVAEFESWLFDDTRKAGDVEIVETADYGAHIMYYVGEGEPQWKLSVESALKSEKYNAAYKALTEKVTVNLNETAAKLVG